MNARARVPIVRLDEFTRAVYSSSLIFGLSVARRRGFTAFVSTGGWERCARGLLNFSWISGFLFLKCINKKISFFFLWFV